MPQIPQCLCIQYGSFLHTVPPFLTMHALCYCLESGCIESTAIVLQVEKGLEYAAASKALTAARLFHTVYKK